MCPFPLSQASECTYKEHSRKGPGHNQDLAQKKGEPSSLGNPLVHVLCTLALSEPGSHIANHQTANDYNMMGDREMLLVQKHPLHVANMYHKFIPLNFMHVSLTWG